MEFSLLFAAAIAAGAGLLMLRWEAARGNAVDCATDLWDVMVMAIVVGLFAGRISAMIASGVNPLTSLGDILIIRGGVATGPAVLAGIITVVVVARGEFVLVADSLAASSLAALSGWHLGCVVRDSCLGTTTDLPWAMSQAGSGVGRHPVELYAGVVLLAAAVILAIVRKRPLRPGTSASTAMLVAGAVRLATEPLRLSLGGGPIWWYAAAIAAGVAGVSVARLRRS